MPDDPKPVEITLVTDGQSIPGLRANMSRTIGFNADRGYVDVIGPTAGAAIGGKVFEMQAEIPPKEGGSQGNFVNTKPKPPSSSPGGKINVTARIGPKANLHLSQNETSVLIQDLFIEEATQLDRGTDPQSADRKEASIWRLHLTDCRFKWDREGLVHCDRNMTMKESGFHAFAVQFVPSGTTVPFPEKPSGLFPDGIDATTPAYPASIKPGSPDLTGHAFLDRRTLKEYKGVPWTLEDLIIECVNNLQIGRAHV